MIVYVRRSFIESVYKELCPEGSTFMGDSNDVDLSHLSEQTNNVPMEVETLKFSVFLFFNLFIFFKKKNLIEFCGM